MRRAALALLLLALAGCADPVDTWAAEQAQRLTQAGVTFPPEQTRMAVINMVSLCVMRGVTPDADSGFIRSSPLTYDWISTADAVTMSRLADQEFCDSVPDGPLGETE